MIAHRPPKRKMTTSLQAARGVDPGEPQNIRLHTIASLGKGEFQEDKPSEVSASSEPACAGSQLSPATYLQIANRTSPGSPAPAPVNWMRSLRSVLAPAPHRT